MRRIMIIGIIIIRIIRIIIILLINANNDNNNNTNNNSSYFHAAPHIRIINDEQKDVITFQTKREDSEKQKFHGRG